MDNADKETVQSWNENAERWTRAVRGQSIPSRQAGTDKAIIDAIVSRKPKRVLDVGCGEGWLSRALAQQIGRDVVGVDGCARLIDHARAAHPTGTYLTLSYDDIVAGQAPGGGPFDVIACSFSLLGEDLAPLLGALGRHLAPGGVVIIQTVHPVSVSEGDTYVDGWRQEAFAAFGEDEWTPMPWYFRTLASWISVIDAAGLAVSGCDEPRHPENGTPLSLLLTCTAKGRPA